ncbi:MAG: thioesterase [Gammaproteobacteria bacterium]|nr:MAG: thioesterase [Gammaproteobacteria bacterium]
MSIWKRKIDLDVINAFRINTLVDTLGIEVTDFGDDYLCAKMPVDHRTHQPMGILHGGASVSLAETVGSIAATMAVDENHYCVGLEINANHLKSARDGYVHATATPIHIGRSTQVWDIKIVNEAEQLVCISRLTMAVLKRG